MATAIDPVQVDLIHFDGSVVRRSYTSVEALHALAPWRDPGVEIVRMRPELSSPADRGAWRHGIVTAVLGWFRRP